MNRQETIQVISLLASNYKDVSEKDDDQKRIMVNTWFECLKDVEYGLVMKAIKELMQTKIFMPTISEIREIAETYKRAMIKNQPKLPPVECKRCNGTGFIMYKKKTNNMEYSYIASCDCTSGNDYKYDGTKVADERSRSEYYIPSISDVVKTN